MDITIHFRDTDVELPVIKKGIKADNIIFIVDKRLYIGCYHKNGCFYSGYSVSARTKYAETKYRIEDLPDDMCQKWAYCPTIE